MNLLFADRLRSDARIRKAKELLIEALADAQGEIQVPRAAIPELVEDYRKLLDRLATARGGASYFPYIASGLGRGPLVELADGSVKLDFISGIGVHGLGHSHPKLLEASIDAALEDTIMQGNLQQHRPSLLVCERLLEMANRNGAKLDHCLLSTSGAMANENALKIAFHNRHPADRVLAMDNCFAGRTIATAQMTDRPLYRTGLPTALTVDYLPNGDANYSIESQQRSVAALDKLLKRHPGKYAALWLELVSGEGGYYPGTSEFFRKLIDRARQDKVLIIFDEVQTFARLSQPFAFQHFGLDDVADIVTIGKITQLCATLYPASLKPKGPVLSQTFTAASSSIAAAIAILDFLESSQCFGPDGENMRRHQLFAAKLEELSQRYPGKISGPFGIGMMVAFTPGDGSSEHATQMVHKMFAAGLMSFMAGNDPSRIRFLPPPGVTTEKDIELACQILEEVLKQF